MADNNVTIHGISAAGQMSSLMIATSSNNATNAATTTTSPLSASNFFSEGGPSFSDLLDTINPLHHIPIVSSIYENLTGDTQSTAAKLAGGALFGGPIGFITSLADSIFQQATGKDMGGTMIAALTGDNSVQVASNTSATTSSGGATPSEQVAMLDPSTQLASAAAANNRDQAVLDLYGTSAPSAHRAYQKAQFRPYLNQVTQSQVV
jgi:hypothetical protein